LEPVIKAEEAWPERNGLVYAKRLLGIYKAELNKPGWRALDNIPNDLMNLIEANQRKSEFS
jgi:hypothetical protein